MSARYLTTTLPYVNADPHVGFALEVVQADALVRSWRLAGNDVFFLTGTDEHGQKIYEASKKAGQEVHDYVDHYAAEFRKLRKLLHLSNDTFIRTTDPEHVAAVQEMWRRCSTAGDIYKKAYTGLYCVGCEVFKAERDLVEGKCPMHPTLDPRQISEENYFFRFSNYAEKLLEYLGREDAIIPQWRREEAIAFVKGGLEDFSISREKARLSWGIPVPDDENQIIYVWFDGLVGYISPLGWPADEKGDFRKFWEGGKTFQVAGKDQVRFQSLMWQAMLMSAHIKNTDQIFYHGFITSGGQKMSKSIENVISPYDLVRKYGTDATRYMLLRHVHPIEDSDVTWERLDEWYTADLVNGLGNLVARTMQMASQYLDSPVDLSDRKKPDPVQQWIEKFEFSDAMNSLWANISFLDILIQNEKSFEVVKTDTKRAQLRVTYYVKELSRFAERLQPFMPETSRKIHLAIKENKKPENLFPRLSAY